MDYVGKSTRPPQRARGISSSSIIVHDVGHKSPNNEIREPVVFEHVPMQFSHITREHDVRFFTGIPSPEIFGSLFQRLWEPKAKDMNYWMGALLNSERERKEESQRMKMADIFKDSELAFTNPANKRGPAKNLVLNKSF